MPEAKKKKIYPIELQEEILKEATGYIRDKYDDDPSILAVYLGGSIADKTFGEYGEPIDYDGETKIGSDIDVMLVIENRNGSVLLSEHEKKQYGVRHIFPDRSEEIPVYRMLDADGEDTILRGKHPIEPMIVTEDLFKGWLSGKNKWGNEQSRPFLELVKKYKVLKETEELRNIREKYINEH